MTKRFAKPHGKDPWCVTTALSAITGLSTDFFRAFVLGIGFRQEWTGVSVEAAKSTLVLLGIDGPSRYHHDSMLGNRPTLNRWIEEHQTGYYMVAAGGHMLLVRDGYVLDNGTWASRKGIHYRSMPRGKRAKMQWSMEIDNLDWHERQDEMQPPQWAVTTGAMLEDGRLRRGNSLQRTEAFKTIQRARTDEAAELRRKKDEALRRKLQPKPEPTAKTCCRCGDAAKSLRRKMCLPCYHKARRNFEFGGDTCKVDGCDKLAEANGCCRNHWRKHGQQQ